MCDVVADTAPQRSRRACWTFSYAVQPSWHMFSSHFKHKPAATKSKLVSYYERTAPQICDKQATNPDTSMFLWKVWVLRQAVRPSRCSISSDFEQTWKNGVWCVCRCSVACMFRLLLVWLLCLDAPQAFEKVGTPMFAHNFEFLYGVLGTPTPSSGMHAPRLPATSQPRQPQWPPIQPPMRLMRMLSMLRLLITFARPRTPSQESRTSAAARLAIPQNI